MAQITKHLKNSTIADGPDPNQVNPSDWNAAHVYSGGALGSLLMRDTGDATYGASWLAAVAAGSVLISNGVGAAPTWAASLTLSGSITATGNVSAHGLLLRDTTPAGRCDLFVGNDASSNLLDIVSFGSGYTPTAAYDQATSSVLFQGGTAGLALVTLAAAAPIRFFTASTERARVAADGTVLINATAAAGGTQPLFVAAGAAHNTGIGIVNTNTSAALYFLFFYNSAGAGAGSIQQTGATSVLFNTTSDARLKTDRGVAIDVAALRAVVVHDFTWTADGRADRGVFAQEAIAVFPRAITEGSDELSDKGQLIRPWGADYSKFVPDLIVGWQAHDARIAALEAAIARG